MPDFRSESGLAIPEDPETLGLFQGLQRAINDTYEVIRVESRIAVDGVIGPSTVAAAEDIGERFLDQQLLRVVGSETILAQNADFAIERLDANVALDVNLEPDPAETSEETEELVEDFEPAGMSGGAKIGLFLLAAGGIGLAFLAGWRDPSTEFG